MTLAETKQHGLGCGPRKSKWVIPIHLFQIIQNKGDKYFNFMAQQSEIQTISA